MPDDLLSRLRVLAAVKSHEEKRRVTLEVMVNEAIAKGLPLLEAEIL